MYFDGIVAHVRGDHGRVSKHTIYVALGVTFVGHKELLGLWLSETEGATFRLSRTTDLMNLALRDVSIACVDVLAEFSEAIHAAFPEAKVQLCIVQLVRAALRYVSTRDSAEAIVDLKKRYQAAMVLEAEESLDKCAAKWDAKYPTVSKIT